MTADIEKLKALAPCPFCNASMEPFGPEQFNHPRNDCWLSSVSVKAHEFDAWNRRAEKEAPDSHVIPPPRGTGSQQGASSAVLVDLMPKRAAFLVWAKERALDVTEDKDAWGKRKFLHSHVQALWDGWFHAPATYAMPEQSSTAGAARQGGITNDKSDSFRAAPWYLTACKMGNAFYNLSQRDDLPTGWNETACGLVEEWDEARKSIGSAPAAGTDKDAERYRLLTRGDIIQPDDEFLSDDCTSWITDPSGIFAGLEYLPGALKAGRRKVAAIGAHTKAGKES